MQVTECVMRKGKERRLYELGNYCTTDRRGLCLGAQKRETHGAGTRSEQHGCGGVRSMP